MTQHHSYCTLMSNSSQGNSCNNFLLSDNTILQKLSCNVPPPAPDGLALYIKASKGWIKASRAVFAEFSSLRKQSESSSIKSPFITSQLDSTHFVRYVSTE